jgi:hypothetical protein
MKVHKIVITKNDDDTWQMELTSIVKEIETEISIDRDTMYSLIKPSTKELIKRHYDKFIKIADMVGTINNTEYTYTNCTKEEFES